MAISKNFPQFTKIYVKAKWKLTTKSTPNNTYKNGATSLVSRTLHDVTKGNIPAKYESKPIIITKFIEEEFQIKGLEVLHITEIDKIQETLKESYHNLFNASSIVINSENDKDFYSLCINSLSKIFRGESFPKIDWIGDNFELSGSTIPVPDFIDNGQIYLSNHFRDYFDQEDSLLVNLTVWNKHKLIEKQFFINPRETLNWNLDQHGLGKSFEGYLAISCTHPKLSKGRHNRWRVWADMFFEDSIISLHSAHDFGPSHKVDSFFPDSLIRKSERLILTIPDYFRDGKTDQVVISDDVNRIGVPIEDESINFVDIISKTDTLKSHNLGISYSYHGYGTSYWFNKIKNENIIYGNHEVSVNSKAELIKITRKMKKRLTAIEKNGFTPAMHLLPLTDNQLNFEFGFTGDWSFPKVKKVLISAFDQDGEILDDRSSQIEDGINFINSWREFLPAESVLIGIRPDFKSIGIDPRQWSPYLSLFVKSKSGDLENTEFQSSWRNLGTIIPEFPHWLNDKKGVAGSTHLVGRWTNLNEVDSRILLINGSGNRNYKNEANVTISLYNKNGDLFQENEIFIKAFTHTIYEIPCQNIVDKSFGFMRIRSLNADLNAYMITSNEQFGVGLQHLWGY